MQFKNICEKSSVLEVSKLEISIDVNDKHSWNIEFIFDTLEVSKFERLIERSDTQ